MRDYLIKRILLAIGVIFAISAMRMAQLERRTLRRETRTVHTPSGDVRIKTATGFGTAREKAEYDDLAQLARKKGCTLSEAEAIVRDAERQAR